MERVKPPKKQKEEVIEQFIPVEELVTEQIPDRLHDQDEKGEDLSETNSLEHIILPPEETIEVFTEGNDIPIETIVSTEPVLLRWKKVGGGSLRMLGMIIKQNQIFEAPLEAIPKAFLSSLICLDVEKLKEQESGLVEGPAKTLFEIRSTNQGLYNVVNLYGKAINDTPLSKETAEKLKKALES